MMGSNKDYFFTDSGIKNRKGVIVTRWQKEFYHAGLCLRLNEVDHFACLSRQSGSIRWWDSS